MAMNLQYIAVFVTWLASSLCGQTGPATMTPAQVGIVHDIVACRMPAANATFRNAFPDAANLSLYVGRGTDLVLIHPDGSEEVLHAAGPNGACVDPVVSFDGKWVFFTKFVDPQAINTQRGVTQAPAHVWKVHLATRLATQLTFGSQIPFLDTRHQVNPLYAQLDVQPTELPDGRILFLSNRGAEVGQSGTTVALFPTLAFWRMDADGKNLEPMEHFTMQGCQHPFILKDGRIAWTHLHVAGRRSLGGGNYPLFVAEQDLSGINVFAGEHFNDTAWHFATQLSGGDMVSCVYYHQNNFGHGTLVRFPVDPPGQDFTPVNPNTAPSQYNIYGQNDSFRRVGETLVTPWNLTPFVSSLSYDEASVLLADGTRAGKSTMPAALPGGHLLFVWSNGNVNNLFRPTPELPHMKICYGANGLLPTRNSLVILRESASFHYLYPKLAAPYGAIYGIPKPPIRPGARNDGAAGLLPVGGPFATTGTSSVYNRESAWPPAYQDPWDVNIVNNFALGTALFTVGQDSHPFQDSKIHAAQVVVDMAHADTRYLTLQPGFRSHNQGLQIWGVLGEVPLRKTNAFGQPLLDQQGHPDTSYEVRIPANAPFHHRLIDRDGLMLTAEWTWHSAKPGERKVNCGGCHAHSTDTAPLDFNLTAAAQPSWTIPDFALQTPMVDIDAAGDPTITTRPERVRIVEYHRDVKPIFQAKCVSCHGDLLPAGGLDLNGDDAVTALAFNTPPMMFGFHQATRWVRRHAAAQSLLVWKAHGQRLDGRTNAARTTDLDFLGTIMPPPMSGVAPLTFQEKRTLALWIDLGCLTDLTPGGPGVGDPFDDQMAPTLVIEGPRGDTLSPLPPLVVSLYDLHSGVDPASLSVVVTPFGLPAGPDLASSTLISDGGIYTFTLPPLAVDREHVIDVRVADLSGNVSRRRLHVRPRSLLLAADDLVRGTVADLRVHGAMAGEIVHYLAGVTGTGNGPCFPTVGNLCLDLLGPILLIDSVQADGMTATVLPLAVPSGLFPYDVSFQAVVLRGPGLALTVKSQAVTASVL